jgi:hypothetical protein
MHEDQRISLSHNFHKEGYIPNWHCCHDLLSKKWHLEQIAFAVMALLLLAARDNPAAGNGGLSSALSIN